MRFAPAALACSLCACVVSTATLPEEAIEAPRAASSGSSEAPTLTREMAAWDEDANGRLDRAEVERGIFDARDLDDDGVLDPSELAAAREAQGAELVPGRLAGLREPEVTAERGDTFAYWDDDADGVLTAEELTDTMVASWDENEDGVVDRAEWPG